jgi:hypothetical protein
MIESEILGALDKGFAIQAFTVMFTVIYISLAYLSVTRIRRRRIDREVRLREAISTGLLNDQVEGVDDLVNIYRGVTNASDDDVSYKAGVSRILRRLLVSLATDPGADHAKRMLKHKIKGLLNQIEEETPFADLPAAERNLVIDAWNFIEKNELNAAKQKITDLAGLIEARQDGYEKLQSANKWAVPLAVIGLVLTVVFGVISLWK